MAIDSLKIDKRWRRNNAVAEADWDAIRDSVLAWSVKTNNNLKQIGLDLNGSNYDFNNVGKQTQSTPIVSRLAALEFSNNLIGTRNIGLSLTNQQKIKMVGADGNDLTATNAGLIVVNATTDIGEVKIYTVTSNQEVTLTGAHWGLDTFGDFTDVRLFIILMDTGSSIVLGVTAQGGREFISTADVTTAVGSVTSIEKILTATTVSSNSNAIHLGWVKADFDDTGNAGGENFWTVQNAIGDINIGNIPTFMEGVVLF